MFFYFRTFATQHTRKVEKIRTNSRSLKANITLIRKTTLDQSKISINVLAYFLNDFYTTCRRFEIFDRFSPMKVKTLKVMLTSTFS